MTVRVHELCESRRYREAYDCASLTRVFLVEDRGDEFEACRAEGVPQVYDNFYELLCVEVHAEPYKEGTRQWKVYCEYEWKKLAGQVYVRWGIASEQQHIELALAQRIYVGQDTPPGEDPPGEFADKLDAVIGLLIGVGTESGKTEVKGCDKYVPKVTYAETREFSTVPAEYLLLVLALQGKTNNALFRIFPAGTLMFMAIEVEEPPNPNVPRRITFHFEYSPNVELTYQTTRGEVKVDKGGHEYVWTRPRVLADQDAESISRDIESVQVATNYESADFAQLGIGTDPINPADMVQEWVR